MRRILFLQKNPPKKKIFPPQRAVVARFARASLAATERRGGSICEIIKNGNLILSLAPYAPRTVQNQYVFQKQGLMQRRVIFKERQKFCSFGAKCKGIQRHCQLYFLRSKKINKKWRRRRKKIRVRCKKASFYTTESLNEPFFFVAKNENGAAGKKFLRYPGRCIQGKHWLPRGRQSDSHYKTPRRIILHPSPPKKKKKGGNPPPKKPGKKKKKPLEEISSPTWRILRALIKRQTPFPPFLLVSSFSTATAMVLSVGGAHKSHLFRLTGLHHVLLADLLHHFLGLLVG